MHSFVTDIDGFAWCCGNNSYGQLGLGDFINRATFTKIPDFKFVTIATGHAHTAAIDTEGCLWVCGSNFRGELGLGDTENRNVFTKIEGTMFRDVTCGTRSIMAIDINGDTWVCGDNGSGQLGVGDTVDRNTLVRIPNRFKSISSIDQYTMAIDYDGFLWGCGYNFWEQIRFGDTFQITSEFVRHSNLKFSEVKCSSFFITAIDQNGILWMYDRDRCIELYQQKGGVVDEADIFKQISKHTFTSLSAGINHIIAIDINNNIWGYGDNFYGQLGLHRLSETKVLTKIPLEGILNVGCKHNCTLAIDKNNRLWCCGYNTYEQLGLGDTVNRKSFVRVQTLQNVVGIAGEHLKIIGRNTKGSHNRRN